MDGNFLLLMLIFFLGNIVESVTGFGSTIIAVTLLAHLYPIHYLVVVFIPLNIVLSLYFVLRYYYAIEHSLLWKKILPLAGLGLPIGILIFNTVQNQILKVAFGIFVIGFSLYELFRILKTSNQVIPKQISLLKSAFFLISGGIMQGAYASGGPLIVYYASKKIFNKQSFRSTLSALWLVLNIFLVINYVLTGRINYATFKADIILLPMLVIGIVIGEWLHNRIPERIFRIFIFLLLLVAGASLVIKI